MIKDTVPGRYWHLCEDGRIQCDLCPRFCRLKDGQRGMCFVRARQGQQMVLTTYGRSSGFCVDPIEKKPLNHFLPGTPVLSFGTAGCNLACKFCQNWDISKSRQIDTLADAASPDQIAETAVELGCRSVAFTYNDPVIFMEYAIDTDLNTYWHTEWQVEPLSGLPHEIWVDMGDTLSFDRFIYTPRQDQWGPNGGIGDYELYFSNDTSNWGSPARSGSFNWDTGLGDYYYKEEQTILLPSPLNARYFRLVALSEHQDIP